MIIRKLRLENFGVYAGSHEIDLAPASREKPIVLFGGLNGGGKTTLLDAIQLTLFGKMSRCSTRGNLAYDEFLKRCITHGTPAGVNSCVSLEIRQTFDAQTHDFVITRQWTSTGKGIAETLLVQRDNVVDTDLAENWLEHVDQFVPVGLAELFFFDGEQIARLAEADNAAQMLTTAINTLLGIDLVDRLEKDLTIYERDISKEQATSEHSEALRQIEVELEKAQHELKALMFEKGRVQTEADQCQKKVEAASALFRRQGGDLFSRRKHLTDQKAQVAMQRGRVEQELREIVSGIAPLLLIEPLVEKVRTQAQREEMGQNQAMLLSELQRRDKAIMGQISPKHFTGAARSQLEAVFAADRKRRENATKVERYLNLEKSASQNVARLNQPIFEELRKKCSKLVKEHEALLEQSIRIDETLDRVPDEASLAQVSEDLKTAQRDLVTKQVQSTMLSESIDKLRRFVAERERSISNLLDKNITATAEEDDRKRKIRFAAKVRVTMKQFRIRVLERKIRQIEGLILESFQQLLRKKDLVSAIKIDPESFRMTLIGTNGVDLHADRLSAGERQLLAVSTLWGLARASGRPLPTIIDTPLGRLDSHHRTNLVENYFPFASHQVVILSTDEEIGQKHLNSLRPRIAKTYELTYSEKTGTTSIVPGYFFN